MLLQPKRYLTLDNQMTDNGLVIKGSGEETIGLVAQEVYKVMPEAVYKPKDDSKELWGLKYDKFIPLLIKGVQEQQKEIVSQRSQIESLKKEIAELRESLKNAK